MAIKISEIEEGWKAGEMEALIEMDGWHCPVRIFGNHDDGVVNNIIEARAVLNEDDYCVNLPVANIDMAALNEAIIIWKESEGMKG